MTNTTKKQRIYYHIIERSNYGHIGYQGYEIDLDKAKDEVKRLESYFPKSDFEIFQSNSKKEPPITTI